MCGIHPRRMSDDELIREAQHTPNAMVKELAKRLAASIDEVDELKERLIAIQVEIDEAEYDD